MLCMAQPNCGELVAHLQEAVPFVSKRWSPPADWGKLSKCYLSCVLVNKPRAATASAALRPCGRRKAWWRFLHQGPTEEEEGGRFLERAGGGERITLPQAETREMKRLQ